MKHDDTMRNEVFVCDICCDERRLDPTDPVMKCKHQFCTDCWNAFLTNKILKEGQCLVRCMAGGCNMPVKEDFVESITRPETYER